MPVNDDLGKRIKENYENRAKAYLLRRTPVAIRIDGKAFHTFTRGFAKPFDSLLMTTMQETMQYLCENIQGCVLGYTQSDEITLILQDYKTLTTDAWFDYSIQKMCSISASMATMAFNKFFERNYLYSIADKCGELNDVDLMHDLARKKCALFDSRCFNIPKEEVTNMLYWRQNDATRNSIQMVGHAYFSDKELFKKTCSEIQDMLMIQKGINWNDYTIPEKRGSCCRKVDFITESQQRSKWIIDGDIPIFINEGRKYIEDLINCEDE